MSYCSHHEPFIGPTVTLDVSETFYREWCFCEHDTADSHSDVPHNSLAKSLCEAAHLPNGRWRLTLDHDGLEWLANQIDNQLDRCNDAFHGEPLLLGAIIRSGRAVERQAKALLAKMETA